MDGRASEVLRFNDCHQPALTKLIQALGLQLELVDTDAEIPGSFWGDEEAGLIKDTLYVRPDTPVHSALHEACHAVCMDVSVVRLCTPMPEVMPMRKTPFVICR